MRIPGAFLIAAMLLAIGLVPGAVAVDIGGGIVNVLPVVTSVTASGSYNPTAGTTTAVPVSTIITDGNGCSDLASVTVAVYTSGDAEVVTPAALSQTSCGLAGAATYGGNIAMPFHLAAGTYKVLISAVDQASASVSSLLAGAQTFTWGTLTAMTSASSFSFAASITPGAATATGQGLSVTNRGNTQMDVAVSGTALTLASPSASIPVSAMSYSVNSDMSSSTALSGTPATLTSFDLGSGASSSKTLYLRLTAPSVDSQYLPAGSYTGTLTVTAAAG
jgi:hypothetical protein